MKTTSAMAVALLFLLAAVPYVAWIHHPSQKLLAAYLIFSVIFVASFFLMLNALGYLLHAIGLGDLLGQTVPFTVLLAVTVIASVALATWQAKKPRVVRKPT